MSEDWREELRVTLRRYRNGELIGIRAISSTDSIIAFVENLLAAQPKREEWLRSALTELMGKMEMLQHRGVGWHCVKYVEGKEQLVFDETCVRCQLEKLLAASPASGEGK